MSNCGESEFRCDLPFDHKGECVQMTIPETFPVKLGGKEIGQATYLGDGMASVTIDDKFAKHFISGSNLHISIATPDTKEN